MSSEVRVLPELTLDRLGVDITTIPNGSNTLVYVECKRCREVFLRERLLIDFGHDCPPPLTGEPNGTWAMYREPVGTLPRLECVKLVDHAQLPTRSRLTDAGYDISAAESAQLRPGQLTKVESGLAIAAPPGFYYTIEGRSSLALRGIVPFRPIIDATYTGPLAVMLQNLSMTPYDIAVGDRVAQLTLHRIEPFDLACVKEFSPLYSLRGQSGWGSSGR